MPGARRIHHATLTVEPERGPDVLTFYRDVLGFPTKPIPEVLADRAILAWFQVGGDELHVMLEPKPEDGRRRGHLCIEVEDLAATRAALERAGHTTRDPVAIPGRPRFFAEDPSGNLLEFVMIE